MRPPTCLLFFCYILFVLYQLLALFVFAAHGDANSTSSCSPSSFTQCANLGDNPYPFWSSAACAAAPSYVLSNCTPSSTQAYWHSFSDAASDVAGYPAVTALFDSSDEAPYAGFASSVQLSWNISLVDSGPCPPDLFSATNLTLYNIPSSINLTRFPNSSALSFTKSNTILLFYCSRSISDASAQSGISSTGCERYKALCPSLAETPCMQWPVDPSTTELMLQDMLQSYACSHFMFGTPTTNDLQDFTTFTPSVIELLWEDSDCKKCESRLGRCGNEEPGSKKYKNCTCDLFSDHGWNHTWLDLNTNETCSPFLPKMDIRSIKARIFIATAAIAVASATVAALGLYVAIRVGFPRFRDFTIPIVISILKNILRKLQSVSYRLHRHSLDLLDLEGLTERPTEYSYSSIALATKSFSSSVGEGGFGTVYKGTILAQAASSGGQGGSSIQQQIAVKVLDAKSQYSKNQFLNEVITIGKIHHVNVVRLLGFCMQEDREMLVYEYLVNGSLDRWLFEKKGRPQESHVLDWRQRYAVALGVARGLSYLHEECRHRTVHCDIKPQNILLDEDMHPKIADFGLARLMNRDESKVVTFAKGTPGYMAPEFWMGGESQLSTKFDVYSYGMVLLELISGQRNFGGLAVGSNDGRRSFPAMAFKAAMEGDLESIVDARLDIRSDAGDAQKQQIKTAAFVALWCIQDHPTRRPHMSEVVKYLEGGAIISEWPPQPTISMYYTTSCPQLPESFLTGSHDYDYNDCTPLSGGR